MKSFHIYQGQAKSILQNLGPESINCCVTSPPYYNLRDYGVDGQIGLEATPEEYISNLVEVFSEVKRVLKKEGTLWVVIGDSYAANRGYQVSPTKWQGLDFGRSNSSKIPLGLKAKDLIGIPWMLAFALRGDGWYLRQDIIWHKPNPMPESVSDRCTKAHEYIFMLTKSATYYFDYESILEQFTDARMGNPGVYNSSLASVETPLGVHGLGVTGNGWNADGSIKGRRKRSVWYISSKPYSGAHFAVFPTTIPATCIKAGCPTHGVVLDPFSGAATTGIVAHKLGREYIGIELNQEYIDLSYQRYKENFGEYLMGNSQPYISYSNAQLDLDDLVDCSGMES